MKLMNRVGLSRSLDYVFLVVFIISLLSLALYRYEFRGYFVPIHFIVFIAFVFIRSLYVLLNSEIKLHHISLFVILSLFLTLSFISTLFADRSNLRNLIEVTIYVLFTLLFTQAFRNLSAENLKTTIKLLMLTLAALASFGLYGYFSGRCINAQFSFMFGDTLGSRNTDIYMLYPSFMIALLFIYFKRTRVVSYLVLLIIIAAIVFSFSRGAILLLLCFYMLSFSVMPKTKKGLKGAFKYLTIAVVLMTPLVFYYIEYTSGYIRLWNRFAEVQSSPRLELYLESFKIMFEHPITGVGMENYACYTNLSSVNGPFSNPHNAYTTFGAETGILGFFTIIVVISYPFIKYHRLGKEMKQMSFNETDLFLFFTGKLLSIYLILVNLF